MIEWHELVGTKDQDGNQVDYVDLLNFGIPGHWFKVSKANGTRVNGRIRREAGSVVKKYTGKKVSGSKREEAKQKALTLHIRQRELVVPEEIENNLSAAQEEVEQWKEKCHNLEREKEELMIEMRNVVKQKEREMGEGDKIWEDKLAEIQEKNKGLSEYIATLEKKTGFLC